MRGFYFDLIFTAWNSLRALHLHFLFCYLNLCKGKVFNFKVNLTKESCELLMFHQKQLISCFALEVKQEIE